MSQKPTWKLFLPFLISLVMAVAVLAGARAAAETQSGEVDLAIEIKAPLHVEPSGSFTLNVSYSNLGLLASPEDTWIEISLPPETSFVSATDKDGTDLPPDTIVDNLLTWQVGAIPPDSCCQHIMIGVQIRSELAEQSLLTSQGEIGSSAFESNLANNTYSVTSTVCDMAGSTKQAQYGQVKPSDVMTYTLTIRMTQRNGQSPQGPREVSLTDTLPPADQAVFLDWISPITGAYDGLHLHWQGQVHPGEPVTLQYRLGIKGETPPGELVTNQAHLGWSGSEMELEPVVVETYLSQDDHMFGPQGGEWQHAYGVTLELPPNAVPETTRFEFKPLFEDAPALQTPPGLTFAQRAFQLTAFQFGELHRFNQPITITVGYDEQDIQGLDRNTLRLWYRAGPGEPWAMLGEPVRHQNGQISFNTDHFSEFILVGEGAVRISLPLVRR